ncbi:MAG TPA: permease-like cell division protein FtsX [Bacillota bacterium]|nr:permease-like cell division protein FtsX [Bacillota bacterium]
MKVKTFWYFTKEAANGLLRNGLMTLTAVGTITLALIILGSFYVLITNTNHFAEMAKGVLEIRVYLKDKSNAVSLQNKILAMEGVKEVRYVSKQEGAKWLEKTLGVKEIFMTTDNPLPDMINIKLKDDANVKELATKVNVLPGVEEIEYGQTFVESMMIIVQVITAVGIGLVIIIGIVVLYIIINTIRLTVFARRKEIEIMKLVGATDWFIRWPFLLEGIMIGLSGAILSVILLSKGYHLLSQYVRQLAPFIPLLAEKTINSGMFFILAAAGFAFGAIGSMVSIKKFLRV